MLIEPRSLFQIGNEQPSWAVKGSHWPQTDASSEAREELLDELVASQPSVTITRSVIPERPPLYSASTIMRRTQPMTHGVKLDQQMLEIDPEHTTSVIVQGPPKDGLLQASKQARAEDARDLSRRSTNADEDAQFAAHRRYNAAKDAMAQRAARSGDVVHIVTPQAPIARSVMRKGTITSEFLTRALNDAMAKTPSIRRLPTATIDAEPRIVNDKNILIPTIDSSVYDIREKASDPEIEGVMNALVGLFRSLVVGPRTMGSAAVAA